MCVLYIGWASDEGEFALIQQELDPNRSGRIGRDRFLAWLRDYCTTQEVLLRVQSEHCSNQHATEETSGAGSSPASMRKPHGKDAKLSSDSPQRPELEVEIAPDWNKEYGSVLSSTRGGSAGFDGDIVQGIAVSTFLKRFREAAESVVQVVVEELALANEAKSVSELPLDKDEWFAALGDSPHLQSLQVAGIRKFWHKGVLVYLVHGESPQSTSATGAATNRPPQFSLHSGVAHKVFGHQVRAARAIHDAIQRGGMGCSALCVPLQCTIDYLGFRTLVIASPQKPGATRRSFFPDQARRDEKVRVQSQLTHVFNALGLMTESLRFSSSSAEGIHDSLLCDQPPSFVPDSATFVAVPREGDAARCCFQTVSDVFTADVSSSTDPTGVSTEYLLFKFRPEFVRLYGDLLPLHSNAHLGDTNSNHHLAEGGESHRHKQLEMHLLQQAAFSASQHLQCEVIPAFVRSMEANSASALAVFDSRSITSALHRDGINMRYLGLCYSLASKKHVRQLFLTEMVARVCKTELRAALRSIAQEHTSAVVKHAKAALSSRLPECDKIGVDDEADPTDGRDESRPDTEQDEGTGALHPHTIRRLSTTMVQNEAQQVVLEFFNLVFGVSASDSKLFWKDRILPHVRLKFGLGGSESSLSLEAITSDESLHLPQLFHSLQAHANCIFADHMKYNFKMAEPFKREDLQQLHLAPLTNVVARTSCQMEDLLESIDDLVAHQQLHEALTRVKVHIAILDSSPNDERALSLSHLLACAAKLSFQMDKWDEGATRFATLAIENGPKNHVQSAKAHTIFMKITARHNDVDAVQSHYARAVEIAQWHLGASHPFLLDHFISMAEIMQDCGQLDEALKALHSCIAMARDCFGRTSLVYADLRRQQGLLLYESKALDEAVGVLEDAASVYEKHFRDVSVHGDDSVLGSSREFAATCCYLIAAILVDMDDRRSTLEQAYSAALRGLTLRKEALAAGHIDILNSFLQLGTLADALDDRFRAMTYFKPALLMLKELRDDASIAQIRFVTQTMLQLQLKALPSEKASVIAKTKKRYATQLSRFATSHDNALAASHSESEAVGADNERTDSAGGKSSGNACTVETELLAFVMKKLFSEEDATAYLDRLIDKTDQELQEYRKQYTMNFSGGTLRQESAEAPSPHSKRLQSPTAYASRFASFSGAGTSPVASSPQRYPLPVSPPASPACPRTLAPGGPPGFASHDVECLSPGHRRLSFSQMECNFLTTATTGEFTYGGQLAALLFLIELPMEEDGAE